MAALNRPGDSDCGRPVVRVLVIPADPARPCRVARLVASSVAFSDTIGGGPLDDVLHGPGYTLHLDETRADPGRHGGPMPVNERARAAVTRLGWDPAPLEVRGDALLAGSTDTGEDVDLPAHVIRVVALVGHRMTTP